MPMRLKRTCREASALILRREDQRLPVVERLALRLHLVICDACPRFVRQVDLMRNAMGRWKAYAEGDTDAG